MSKKVVKAEVINVPIKDQNIDASIDMKLTKQDLIDVVIEETRERLEAQVQAANDLSNEARAKIDTALREANKTFMDAVREKHKAEFKLLKSHGGEERDPQIGHYYAITERGILLLNDIQHRGYNRNQHTKPTLEDSTTIERQFKIPSFVSVSNKSKDNGYGRNHTEATASISIGLTFNLSKTELVKLFAPIVSLVKDFDEKENSLQDLQSQLHNVDKMGKKAKTQLIKRILEGSEDGQALLSNMGAIKTNVAQLLLDATKKE